jgi:hypothetical protein
MWGKIPQIGNQDVPEYGENPGEFHLALRFAAIALREDGL